MLPIKITNRPLPLSLHVSLHLFRAVSLADTRFKRKSILIRRPTSVHPSIRSRKYRTRRVHYHTRREGRVAEDGNLIFVVKEALVLEFGEGVWKGETIGAAVAVLVGVARGGEEVVDSKRMK